MGGHRKFEKRKELTAAELTYYGEIMLTFKLKVRQPNLDTDKLRLISSLEALAASSKQRRPTLKIKK